MMATETEKLQRELVMKCIVETSTKNPVTQNNNCEDYGEEKDNGELEPNSGNGSHLSNSPWTQTLPLTVERVFNTVNEVDATAFSFNTTMDDSLEKKNPKNPLLLIPVIRCVLKFLNIEDMKNFRLVCYDWGSVGKRALASRALIRFHKYEIPEEPSRLPVDFQSCFLDSTSNFSAFNISGFLIEQSSRNSWSIEELSNFFDVQQKYIKELTLEFENSEEEIVKKIDLGSWISKSPMVQQDTKYMTKLTIDDEGDILNIRPLHLIRHIKDLSLSNCRIHVERGIKINPIKLKLSNATFYQDGNKLTSVRINDIVELGKTKELSLRSWDSTEYVLDLWGSFSLEKLILDGDGIEILNGETSQWAIEHLAMTSVPFSLNNQMNIKELYLNSDVPIDLPSLPTSIQNLVLPNINNPHKLICRQPKVLPNLQYLQIVESYTDFSFLSLFMNCSQLVHLKLSACNNIKLKSLWMPKSIKTLTLENCMCKIKWLDENYWNLETLVVHDFPFAQEICEAKIVVQDLVVNDWHLRADRSLVDFLEHRKRFSFGKRLFIGRVTWDDEKFEGSVLFDHVVAKSSFYVFQDGQKGSELSEKDFYELIPKHLDVQVSQ